MRDSESCFCKPQALGRWRELWWLVKRLLYLTFPAEAAVCGCSRKELQQTEQGAMEKVNDQIKESHS